MFSKGFCIARLLYFPKNRDFHDELYSVIKNILHFCFWKDTFRNKNRCENSFHFFCFFCECLWKTNVRWWKNCKNRGFHVFYQFSVTQKPLPGNLILRTKTDFRAYIVRLQKTENTKILEKSLFQFRVERCHKNHLFHDLFHVYFNFWSRTMFALLHSRWRLPANFFPY